MGERNVSKCVCGGGGGSQGLDCGAEDGVKMEGSECPPPPPPPMGNVTGANSFMTTTGPHLSSLSYGKHPSFSTHTSDLSSCTHGHISDAAESMLVGVLVGVLVGIGYACSMCVMCT